MTDNLTPGDRRELRSVVKNRFKVLRAEVKRREQEMKAEIEKQLLERYRDEDAAVAEARREVQRINAEAVRQAREVGDRLREAHPDLMVEVGFARYGGGGLDIQGVNQRRGDLHRALIAAIPDRIGDANLSLDRQETELLQELSVGALETDQAKHFLASIPTVGELVPTARLRELESSLNEETNR